MQTAADFDWKQIHDAVLKAIVINWELASADFTLDLPSPPNCRLTICARRLVSLSCPREQPWGRSVHVNGATIAVTLAGGPAHLRIEMQSGDVIDLKAESIDLEKIEQ
jgi:hypothetical protein